MGEVRRGLFTKIANMAHILVGNSVFNVLYHIHSGIRKVKNRRTGRA